MKRNDDGYVLPLVLVVLLVLGIIVSSVLTASLQNLRFQNNSIIRTEARCEAEGVVEIVKAQVLALVGEKGTNPPVMDDELDGTENKKVLNETKMDETVISKLTEIQNIFQNSEVNKSGLSITVKIKDNAWSETVEKTSAKFEFPVIIEANSSDASLSLKCEMKVEGNIKLNEPKEEGEDYSCEIETIKVQYTTYQIGGAA